MARALALLLFVAILVCPGAGSGGLRGGPSKRWPFTGRDAKSPLRTFLADKKYTTCFWGPALCADTAASNEPPGDEAFGNVPNLAMRCYARLKFATMTDAQRAQERRRYEVKIQKIKNSTEAVQDKDIFTLAGRDSFWNLDCKGRHEKWSEIFQSIKDSPLYGFHYTKPEETEKQSHARHYTLRLKEGTYYKVYCQGKGWMWRAFGEGSHTSTGCEEKSATVPEAVKGCLDDLSSFDADLDGQVCQKT